MYDELKKYLRGYKDDEDLEEDEEIVKARKRADDSRLMETIGSMSGDLSKLGTLGGVAPKSSLPEYFTGKRKESEFDLKNILGEKSKKQKELLARLEGLRGIEREERGEERYKEEKDYRREQEEKQAERRRLDEDEQIPHLGS